MKKLPVACGAALLGVITLGWVAAQGQQHHPDPAATGLPTAHQLVVTSFVLPELQPELGLSMQQVAQLRQLKREMLTRGKDLSDQIAAKRKELDGLVGPGTSKGELVKRLFEQIGKLRGQQLYTGYETAIKMRADLTDAQRSKLASMKTRDIRKAMASRMTVSDMMEMMQFMGNSTTDDLMDGMTAHGMTSL